MKLTSDLLKTIVLAELNLFQANDKSLDSCDESNNSDNNDNNSNEISLDEIRRITREEIRNFIK